MTLLHLALDVVREAVARRFMLALFACIAAFVALLAFALDLEVVQGTLAAGRLFGESIDAAIVPVDVAMKQVFMVMAYGVFYLGVTFGVIATSGIAATLLAPGRVELLLALPVRRGELVVAIYLGVMLIALLGTSLAVGGISAVFFLKTHFVTPAPLFGGLAALIAFAALYGAMLLVTTWVRSATLAAGAGLGLFVAGNLASNRLELLALFKPGLGRTLVSWLATPLPRFRTLASFGADAAIGGTAFSWDAAPTLAAALCFGLATLAVAAFVVMGKDY